MPEREHSRWIVHRVVRREPRLRLFCLPFAGGGASTYRTWHRTLDADVELCPVELPGRETRLGERPFRAVIPLTHALGDALYPFFDKPFALFGHSMGALIVFEIARWLRRHGGPMPERIILSAAEPPQLARDKRLIHELPDTELLREIRELDGTPTAVLDNAELMALLLPILRADLAMDETYRYAPEPPLDVPLLVLGGDRDRDVRAECLGEWQEHTTHPLALRIIPGGHFFINDSATVLKHVAAALGAPLGCPVSVRESA